jgi:hypothetical protein
MNAQLHFTCGGVGTDCPNITSPSQGVWRLLINNWAHVGAAELARYKADIADPQAIVGVKIKHGGQVDHCTRVSVPSAAVYCMSYATVHSLTHAVRCGAAR